MRVPLRGNRKSEERIKHSNDHLPHCSRIFMLEILVSSRRCSCAVVLVGFPAFSADHPLYGRIKHSNNLLSIPDSRCSNDSSAHDH